MTQIYVKPKADRTVPDPDRGDYLPEAGRTVEDNQYWQRRILDGDVEVTEPPKEAPPPVASTSTK